MEQLKEILSRVIGYKGLFTKDDIHSLNDKFNLINEDAKMLKEEIDKLQDRCTCYESQIDALTNIYKNNNLIFTNLEYTESPSTVYPDIIKQFRIELLDISENI